MLIFTGVYHLYKYFKNDIDSNTLFTRSATGFLNEQLGLVYIKHFDKFTKHIRKGVYRMLLFNGYRSYLSQEFIDYC
jgi:hypothetical protein